MPTSDGEVHEQFTHSGEDGALIAQFIEVVEPLEQVDYSDGGL